MKKITMTSIGTILLSGILVAIFAILAFSPAIICRMLLNPSEQISNIIFVVNGILILGIYKFLDSKY